MHRFWLFWLVIPALLLFSCTENAEKKTPETTPIAQDNLIDQTFKEVMAIHDEVMPRMGDINRIRRTLKNALEEKQDSVGTAEVTRVQQAILQLEEADSLMMEWMAAFNPGYAQAKTAQDSVAVLNFLEKERVRITTVRDRMLESINYGNEILSTNSEVTSPSETN